MLGMLKAESHRIWMTIVWSWQGWAAAWASEKSLRQWTLANVISAGLALMLDFSAVERAMIIGFGLLILAAELLNTGIEEAVNRISTDENPLSKKAKDAGSAGVAVTAITAGLVWLILLIG